MTTLSEVDSVRGLSELMVIWVKAAYENAETALTTQIERLQE